MILVEKHTGEALQRVKGTEPGHGLGAYGKLHMWYARQTTLTLQELRDTVMKPVQAKHESEVAARLEEWAEANVEWANVEHEHMVLPEAYRISAIRGILIGKSMSTLI